ncbi:heavy metal translocating P-type ATPase [Anaerosporobacter faecicola]|uniref:heavy metal translocating P-type ATPase n=1 Tax=Anaerosporobacter faecicola TaxID=2718714 RepID=UPI0014393DC9|nr:heavy metal translocating P-type ATPase [Anaerosporobacter faecicola]
MKKTEYVFLLEHLGCANCAAKMERKLNALQDVKTAQINFVNKKLLIEYTEPKDAEEIRQKIEKLCRGIESEVTVTLLENSVMRNSSLKGDEEIQGHRESSCGEHQHEHVDCSCGEHKHEHDDCSCGEHQHAHEDCSCDEHKHEHDNCSCDEHKHAHDNCSCDEHKHEHDDCSCDEHKHAHEDHSCGEHQHAHGEHSHNHGHEHGHSHTHGSLENKSELYKKILFLFTGLVIGFIPIIFDLPTPATIVLLLAGYLLLAYDVLLTSIKNISHGEIFDENFLLIIATIGAFYTKQYPEALMVILLFQIGELLQDIAVDHSRKQLTTVLGMKPEYANKKTKDGIRVVLPEEVSPQDIIVVKPSERIPLDGEVIEGSSFLDTSSLTGESVPRKASVGDAVLSGCINGSGTLYIRVTSSYSNSTIAKVLDLVENASNRKSSTEHFITKFAAIYTPIVVLLALILAILPPIITGSHDFSQWIYRACGFLVVSCPCALVISVPLGFFGGIGCASKHGILIKGSNYLEALNSVETAVFDKTGTLTKGVFTVTKIQVANSTCLTSVLSKEELQLYTTPTEQLQYIAGLVESFSNHPIARSIVSAAKVSVASDKITDYEEIAGFGITATLAGHNVLAGSSKLMKQFHISFQEAPVNTLGSIVYIAIDQSYAGYLVISDEVKKDSASAMEKLHKLGIHTVMLTGDVDASAQLVGKQLGLDQIYSELLPGDKVEKIEELLQKKTPGKNIIFTGDGMNDAPVLARSDIGFAMGGVGSDAAIEAADIVIMTDEPTKISEAIKIAKRTRRIVTENIILSLSIKAIVLLLLANGMGSMWLAIFADVGVALIAIFNSIRTLKYKV